MEFKTPLLLVLVPFVLAGMWYAYRRRIDGGFQFPSFKVLKGIHPTWRTRFAFAPFALRLLSLALLGIALAGPRVVLDESKVTSEGIDIVLALDDSGSMAAEDFKINGRRMNRFDIIKKVVAEFINERKNDRLGLIAFAGRAYTVCPLTIDREWLTANLDRLRLGMIEDGTAIGSGLASSLTRFKNSTAKSKVVILLTDGVNNAGSIDPLESARAAAAMGVKVYTIGAGSKGMAPFPVQDMFGHTFYQNIPIDIDENSLNEIARLTNGQYFRATDTESLRQVYKAIDQLEKSKIEQTGYKQYKELFYILLIAALIVFALEILLANTLFFKVP